MSIVQNGLRRAAFAVMMVLAVVLTLQGAAFAAGAKGSTLAAGGGEPGKDYLTYVKALQKRDGATIRKMAEVGPVSDKELKEQMDMVAGMMPTDIRIVSGTLSADTAVLNATGMLDGKKQYGTIEMKKKGGVWKSTKEDWSEKPKKP